MQRAAAALAVLLGLAAASASHGAELRLLVDTDASPATGCTVATANGAFAGVERRFTATVDTTQDPPRVTGVTQENCVSAPSTFGAPTAVGGGSAIGIGNGTGGANVIEVGAPIAGSRPVRIGIEYVDAAIGADAVTVAAGGGPILVLSHHAPGHVAVPTLSDAVLLLLALLVVAAGWRFGRRHLPAAPLAVVALALVTTLAWAAIVLDGQTSDWAGIPALATDPADAPDGADITAVFATIEGATLFVRADVRTGMPPSAVDDAYDATTGTTLAIAAGAGVLANDTRGVPAATVASFGGGSLGGTATSNAVGATASFGAGGALTVNADGSFSFTPAAGFTGSFTFDYRIANANGASEATVTVATRQAPAITSAGAASFNVGTPGSFTVTATGFPAPTLSLSGSLPAGVTFNAATGVLSGTPAAATAGTYPLTFVAANGVAPDATQAFTLTVTQGVAITSAATATFTVGTAGAFTITTTSSPVAGAIAFAGTLPAGLSFTNHGNGTATIAGTPAPGQGGLHPLTFTASNGIPPDGTQAFTLVVQEAPAITSAATAAFTVGAAGSFTVTATGHPAPSLGMAGTLPAGVTFDSGTGVLSGTPAPGSGGTYALMFTATNGVGVDASQGFVLTVDDPASAVDDAYATVHDTPLVVPAPGVLANDGGVPPPALASVTGTGAPCSTFPCAITTAHGDVVVQADGAFTYTPAAAFAGSDSFTYGVVNASGTGAATVTLTVTNAAPVVDLNGPAAGIDFDAVFTEGALAVAIVDAAELTIADADGAELTGATVAITNPLDGPAEVLVVTCPDPAPGCSGAIQQADVVYTAASATLEILATAPLADFQALLRTLAYHNASASPDGTTRDVTVTINDGIADNAPLAHARVAIDGVNQAPVITAPAAAMTPVDTARVFAGTVSLADPDAAAADVKVTLTAVSGTATLSTTAGLAVTGNGSALLTATGPIASQNAALNGLAFTPAAGFSGAASLRIDVDDLGNTGSGGALTDTHTIAITVDDLPAVTGTLPAAGDTAASTTGTLTVTFNEPVTASAASFTLDCPAGTPQGFTVSASPSASIVLTPTAALPAGAACRLTVAASQVSDSAGQHPAADTVVDFTTNTLPTVTSTVPANGASAVQLGATIGVTFSEPVQAAASAFTLQCPAGTPVAFTASASPAASFTLTPAANLPAGTTCAAGVVASQVTDVDAGQAMAADHAFGFTTGTPPAFTSGTGATFVVGTAGSFPVSASGTPAISSLVMGSVAAGPGGVLPTGVGFTYAGGASGLLSGTATDASHVGTYQLRFTASNGIAPDAVQSPFTLTLECPTITVAPAGGSTFTAAYNAPFSQAFTASGGNAPYTYSLAGSLPGLALASGTLSGTPSNTGSFGFTVQATDNYGCTSPVQSYTLNIDPQAMGDAYDALGNVLVNSSAGTPFAVTDNDVFPAGATISAFDAASAQGGTVALATTGASLGRFTYNPPTGYTGTDSFTYTLASNGRTAIGTVEFTVSGMAWFVDNTAGACPGTCDGRLTNPFTDIAALQAENTGAARKPGNGHAIFVHSGSGSAYAGDLTLRSGQRLVGQGAAASFAALGVLTPRAGQVLPFTGATRPVLGGKVTATDANFIHGVVLAGNPALAGDTFGTLTVNDNVVVNTAGAGLALANGNLVGALASLTSSGGAANVSLANVTTSAGSFALGTGALSGATTGDALSIDGGDGSFAYAGTISNGAASAVAVRIANKTGGTVTLDGAINPGGPGRGIAVTGNKTGANTITFAGTPKRISAGAAAGVTLDDNAGATIAFTNGNLQIATTTGAGFSATNGAAAVTVTGTGNTIASAGGIALNVANTAIGSGNLQFTSIAANGGTSGIVLENTGAAGGLVVSGSGSAAVGGDASGGTIQNTTTYGVRLTGTRNVSLTNMAIRNTGRSGIDGLQVTNFSFASGTVDISGTAAAGQFEESNIAFNDGGAFLVASVDGVVSITNSVLTKARRHGIQIENGAGTIADLVITGNTLTSSPLATESLGTAILVMPQGSGGTAAHLTKATIAGNTIGNFPGGEGIFVGGGAGSTSNATPSTLGAAGTPIAITGNRIDGGATRMGSNAIRASFNGLAGQANFTIADNNPVTNIQGQGVSVFMGGSVVGTTSILRNTVAANQTLLAGTQGIAVQVDDGPAGMGNAAADYNFVISNNSVSNYEGTGIRAIARASLGHMDLTIDNNTVGAPIMANRNGIRIDSGSAVGDVSLCLAMAGNISAGSGVNQGIGIRKQGTVSTTNEFGIVGLAPSPASGAAAASAINAANGAGGGTDVLSGANFISCTITP